MFRQLIGVCGAAVFSVCPNPVASSAPLTVGLRGRPTSLVRSPLGLLSMVVVDELAGNDVLTRDRAVSFP